MNGMTTPADSPAPDESTEVVGAVNGEQVTLGELESEDEGSGGER